MRDLIFIAFFALMVIAIFRKPFTGIAVWVWTALVAPSFLTYSFASGLRYNLIVAAVTMLSFVINKTKEKLKPNFLFFLVIIFFIHSSISAFFAIYESPAVYREWDKFFRIIILFIFCFLILRKKHHVILVCWGIVFSIGFYGVVEGLKFISSAGGHRIEGPSGTILFDNNHLAVALNMTIPIFYFLATTVKSKLYKKLIYGAMALSIVAVVGTFSRGGSIGLAVIALNFLLNSKNKFKFFVMIVVAITLLLSYAPESWFNRISTMENADEDASFMGRVVAWKQSTLIGLDNPVLGGGFHAVQTEEVWLYYADRFNKLNFIDSPHAHDIEFKAAHSIYFEVLGNQGVLGLFIFGLMLLLAFNLSRRLGKLKLDEEFRWISDLANVLKVSISVFMVCGALLSLAYFELFYVILALLIILNGLVVNIKSQENKKQERAIVSR